MSDEFRKMKELKRQAVEKNKQLYEENSRKRLGKIVQTKVKTTMIGALSEFESAFGSLWGHGLPEDQLTVDQKLWRTHWEDTRKAVLDKGNHQIRAIAQEIDQYSISWNRYSITLPVIQPQAKGNTSA